MSKKIEEQIKPILEKLTFSVLKNKPDNIVSNKYFYFLYQPRFMVLYLQEQSNYGPDKLTAQEKKELADLRKELKKFKEMDSVTKHHSGSNSGSED